MGSEDIPPLDTASLAAFDKIYNADVYKRPAAWDPSRTNKQGRDVNEQMIESARMRGKAERDRLEALAQRAAPKDGSLTQASAESQALSEAQRKKQYEAITRIRESADGSRVIAAVEAHGDFD